MAALNCQITRNPYNNQIDRVEDKNGNESQLYQDALDITGDPEKALDIWSVNYTDDFRDITDRETPKPKKSNKKGYKQLSNQGSSLYFKKSGNNVNLELIESNRRYRNRGYANKLMSDFTNISDKNGDTIRLLVSPRDNTTEEGKLVNFYKKHGFVFESQFGVPSEFEMIRRPQPYKSMDNGEANIETVLNYIRQSRTTKLTSKDSNDVTDMLVSLNKGQSSYIAGELKKIFPNGTLNPYALEASGMFTESEKNSVLNDENIVDNLKELKLKLDNSPEVTNDFDYDENFVIYKPTKNDYGKYETENPFQVENEVVEQVAGITDRQDFDSAFNELKYPSLVDKYNSNESFAQEMYERYSSLKRIPRQEVADGEITETPKNSRTLTVKNTASFEGSNFGRKIRLLSQTPLNIWEGSPEDIQQGLRDIETEGVEQAIDLEGLADSYNTKQKNEIVRFLATLNNFENEQTQENLNSFLEAYQEFFGIPQQQAEDIRELPPQHRNKTLTSIKNPLGEYEMFNEHSLVKFDNNLYQKVNKLNLDNLYNAIYAQAVVRDNRVLPNKAYFGNDKLDNSRLKNPNNKEEILQNIKDFTEDGITDLDLGTDVFENGVAKQLLLYKYYFNNPITTKPENNFSRGKNGIYNYDGNTNYLTSNYISDFQTLKLKARENNTSAYNEVYSQFEVNDEGIVLKNTDSLSKEKLRTALQTLSDKEFKDLKNYSVISKNQDLKDLFTYDYGFEGVNEQRQYYKNNIEALGNFTGTYSEVNNEYIKTREADENFIRINQQLFEKSQEEKGTSFYKKIPHNTSEFNLIDDKIVQEPVDKLPKQVVSENTSDTETAEETNNSYTKKQLEEINDGQFDCQ